MSFDAHHYEQIRAGAIASADVIVPQLAARWASRDVVDVGCGEAWFGSAFAALDATVNGIDLQRPETLAPGVNFMQRDLSVPGDLIVLRADLALCLEVAEHLPPARGESLVADLVRSAPVVAFSAAPPGQTGHGHVNCRPQSYWARLFENHGYRPNIDVRDLIWDDRRVEPWYRQNLVVYELLPPLVGRTPLLDVIHPEIFAWFAPA